MRLVCIHTMRSSFAASQLKDIGSGNFGVAKLMRYKPTGELVAVKFIERGDKVTPPCLPVRLTLHHRPWVPGHSSSEMSGSLTLELASHAVSWSELCERPRLFVCSVLHVAAFCKFVPQRCVRSSVGASTRAACAQIDKNVEREIVNHRTLLHPNIIKFREASLFLHWLLPLPAAMTGRMISPTSRYRCMHVVVILWP